MNVEPEGWLRWPLVSIPWCGLLLLLVATVALSGCFSSLSFSFGQPPIAPRAGTQATQCAFRNRITVRRGHLMWKDYHRLGRLVVITDGQVSGLSFFQGSRLVRADSVLDALGDPALARAYRAVYSKQVRTRRIGMIVGWTGLSTALASTAIGSALLGDHVANHRGRAQLISAVSLLGLAAVGYIVGGIELGAGYHARDIVEAHQNLFLARDYEKRVTEAVQRYNDQTLEKCGSTTSTK